MYPGMSIWEDRWIGISYMFIWEDILYWYFMYVHLGSYFVGWELKIFTWF